MVRAKLKILSSAAAAGLAGAVLGAAPLGGCAELVAPAREAPDVPTGPAAPAAPAEAKVKPLFSKALKEFAGKEGVMLAVEYPPGSVDAVHRHNAHAFVYVLEGSIVMQLRGQPAVTLTAGDTFYEGPDDVHVVGRNASRTEPARFVVFLVKDRGAPVLVHEK